MPHASLFGKISKKLFLLEALPPNLYSFTIWLKEGYYTMKGWIFLIFSVVLAVIDVLVPYLFFTQTGSFAASFLFWCLLTLAVIIFGIFYTRGWRGKS